jgi:hypothetical protein
VGGRKLAPSRHLRGAGTVAAGFRGCQCRDGLPGTRALFSEALQHSP